MVSATTEADRYQKISGNVSRRLTNNSGSYYQLKDGESKKQQKAIDSPKWT